MLFRPPTPDASYQFFNDLYPKVASGFERPRAPVMQILWGVINRGPYRSCRKDVGFTKLIIHYLQSKHKFHTRPGSPLHLPNEEPVLGYLKFSSKGTKREVFGMPIPNDLITDDIREKGFMADRTRLVDEEAIVQKVLEESMKDAYPAHRGPLPPVVFREPDSGKLQPLPEVQGKGKEKVGEEQAAQVLLNLQTPKKRNPAEQFIFQRRTPATTEPSGLVESLSLYAELGLTDSGTESDEEVSPEINAQGQEEEGQGLNNSWRMLALSQTLTSCGL
ncbi:hypothetical protein Tco_0308128 [Tanacetum coccineum]